MAGISHVSLRSAEEPIHQSELPIEKNMDVIASPPQADEAISQAIIDEYVEAKPTKFFIPGPLGTVALFAMGLAPAGDEKRQFILHVRAHFKAISTFDLSEERMNRIATYVHQQLRYYPDNLDYGLVWEVLGDALRNENVNIITQGVFARAVQFYGRAGDHLGAIGALRKLIEEIEKGAVTGLQTSPVPAQEMLIAELEEQIKIEKWRERLPLIAEKASLLVSIGRLGEAKSEIGGADKGTGGVLSARDKGELRFNFAEQLMSAAPRYGAAYPAEAGRQYRRAAAYYEKGGYRCRKAEVKAFLAWAKHLGESRDYTGEIKVLQTALDAAERYEMHRTSSLILEKIAVAQGNGGRYYDAAESYNALFNKAWANPRIRDRSSRGRMEMLQEALSERSRFADWARDDIAPDTLWAVYNELDSIAPLFRLSSRLERWKTVRAICDSDIREALAEDEGRTEALLAKGGWLQYREAELVKNTYRALQSGRLAEGSERRAAEAERGKEGSEKERRGRAEDAERGKDRGAEAPVK